MKNTKLTQKEKLQRVEALFNEMKELFPEKSIGLTIHSIAVEASQLPKGWIVDHFMSSGKKCKTAKNNLESWGITVFE